MGKAYLDYLKALNKGIDYSSLSFDAGKLLHKYDNFNNAVPIMQLKETVAILTILSIQWKCICLKSLLQELLINELKINKDYLC